MKRHDRRANATAETGTRRRIPGSGTRSTISRLVAGRTRRSAIIALSATLSLGAIGVAVATTIGEPVSDQIIEFGPVDAATGYPTWYRDAGFEHEGKAYDSLDLEPCIGDTDPLCLPAPLPHPEAPASVKTLNMPDEFFYYTNGAAALESNGANPVLFESAVEGAWSAEEVKDGDQVVFGRIRIRVEGLQPGSTYKVIHPQGVDEFTADAGKRGINYTQDIAAAPGKFDAVFKSRVGPFLRWAPNPDDPNDVAPTGYIGDPAVDHKVIGSPRGTNYVMITGDQVGAPDSNPGANTSPCGQHLPDGVAPQDCIYTDLFNVAGKLSKTGGVDTNRATYQRAADGTTAFDVFSRSKGSQKMVVQDATGSRFPDTNLLGWQGKYFAHVNVASQQTEDDLGGVKVVNESDDPNTVQEVDLTDLVTVTSATYDTDAQKLTVKAQSSDKYASQGTLTLPDFKDADLKAVQLVDGTATVDAKVAPATVKVASSEGGIGVGQVVATGATSAAPLEAVATGPGSVEQGAPVTLSAANSSGNIAGYEWAYEPADGGPAVDLGDTTGQTLKFTAPTLDPASSEATLTFALTVTGAGADAPTSTTRVSVVVRPLTAPRAVIAGASPRPVEPGATITLDGTRSLGAATFEWTDVATGNVLGTDPTLSYTAPQTGSVTLQLKVTNAAGDANAIPVQLDVAAQGTVTPGKVRYIQDKRRWIVDGTATTLPNNTVSVFAGPDATGQLIGKATVDAAGAWTVDVPGSDVTLGDAQCGDTVYCVSIVASRGGEALGVAVERVDRLPAPNQLPADQQPTAQPAPAADPGAGTGAGAGTVAGAGIAAQGVAGVTAAGTGAGTVAAAGAVPLLGAARTALALSVPTTVNAATAGAGGIPITLNVPVGATIVQLRVLTTAGSPLFSAFKKVNGGTKVKLKVKSAKLRRQLRAGKRYIIEVRAGTSKTRLGKATRKQFRVRR
jgi:hypothetical protein